MQVVSQGLRVVTVGARVTPCATLQAHRQAPNRPRSLLCPSPSI